MTDETLFAEALERPSAADRRAFIDVACAGDPSQRQRLDALLAGHDRATGILDGSTGLLAGVNFGGPAERAGALLAGRYKLLEEIGEGGMGSVWAAEQMQPVRRKVAVKLVKAGMDSKTVLARFEAERQALALMDHPNIAKVLDGGTTDAGRPFFVMEYVKGIPITAYCDEARLSIAERLRLFVPVCRAVQHAHTKGIVHRDMKPSNILICQYDGRPVPKVIDFGLAKAMHQPLTERTLHTAHGQMLGTPLYMSPEQAESNNLDVDTRADVYALGVVLYELLTGTTPLERERFRTTAWDEALRLIREEEPPRPSTRLSGSDLLPSVAAQRQLEPIRLTRLVRGELDWIVMKCLEKDRARRYETANSLASDVERYLTDEPVLAGPPSALYRFRKFARRHWRALATASAFLLLLVAAVATLAAALVAVNRERQEKIAALEAEGRRRQQTRAALDAMTSDVIEEWLARQPQLSPDHKRFLETALRWYEEFAADTGQQAESRAAAAQAYSRVGFLRHRLGQLPEAETAWRRGQEIHAGLVAEFPSNPHFRQGLGNGHLNLGIYYGNRRQAAEAESALRQALSIFSGLAAETPDEPASRKGRSTSLYYLARSLRNQGRFPEAEEACTEALAVAKQLSADFPAVPAYREEVGLLYLLLGGLYDDPGRPRDAARSDRSSEVLREAVAVFKGLVTDHPTRPWFRNHLAASLNDLGMTLLDADRHPEAEGVFRQALTIKQQLAAEFPALPGYRHSLASTHNNLGTLFKNTARPREAEESYGRSAALHRQLAADFPDVPVHRNEAAGAMANLARQHLIRKDFAGARRILEEAVPYQQAALKASPDYPANRRSYRLNRWAMADALLGLNNHAGAAEAAEQFIQLAVQPPRDAYIAAGLLAGCARLAAQDERLPEAERHKLATSYGDRAVASLRQAVAKKAKEIAGVKTDSVLDPLRPRTDFQKLLTEIDAARRP
jgi:serine/threonine protein kinase/tetratricopeptide (TPR) repeat protein